jgi:hypothetical protein
MGGRKQTSGYSHLLTYIFGHIQSNTYKIKYNIIIMLKMLTII